MITAAAALIVPSLLLTVIDCLLLIDREYRRIKAELVVKTLGTIGLISVSSPSQRQYHAYLELIVCALLQKRAKAQTA